MNIFKAVSMINKTIIVAVIILADQELPQILDYSCDSSWIHKF